MEANRDAARHCLNVATRALEEGDLEKARRFAEKSHEMFPTPASEKLVAETVRNEANRQAAEQSLIVATRHRNAGDLEKASKFAKKSFELCPMPSGKTMLAQLEQAQAEQRAASFRTNFCANFDPEAVAKVQHDLAAIRIESEARIKELEARHEEARRERDARRAKIDEENKARRKQLEAEAAERELEELYEEVENLSLDPCATEAESTPNDDLNFAMEASSPKCVMCSLEDEDDSASAVAVSEAVQSVATSAVTLESTLHLRERKAQRGITRRELQSVLKHGVAERDPETGRVMHRHSGVCFVTDPSSKVGVTAWSEASCKGRRCDGEATCFRGFCDKCCWGCDEHVRCKGPGCTRGPSRGYDSEDDWFDEDYEPVLCGRGFCADCCWGCSLHVRCRGKGCKAGPREDGDWTDLCDRGFCGACCSTTHEDCNGHGCYQWYR